MDEELEEALAKGTRLSRSNRTQERDRYPGVDAIRQFRRGVVGMLEEIDGGMTVAEVREQLEV